MFLSINVDVLELNGEVDGEGPGIPRPLHDFPNLIKPVFTKVIWHHDPERIVNLKGNTVRSLTSEELDH